MMYVAKRTYLNRPGDYEAKLFANALNLEDAMYFIYHKLQESQDDFDRWYYFQRENGIIDGYDVNGVSDEQQARDDVTGEEADEIWEIKEASDDDVNAIKSDLLNEINSKIDSDADYKTWFAAMDLDDQEGGNGSYDPEEAIDIALRMNLDCIVLIYDDGNDDAYESVNLNEFER